MELNRLSRIVRDRWPVVVLSSLIGFVAAFGFTTFANADVETLFETVVTLRFDPEEGETVQDVAEEVEDAHALAVFAAEEIISENPSASISFDTSSGRIFFRAETRQRGESIEVAQAMVQAYLERDPIAGGEISDQLLDLVETATEIEARMEQLRSRLTPQEEALIAQHDLLDRQISTLNDRIVALTAADIGATSEEQASNAALRGEAEQVLAGLLAEKAALPPRPSDELSAEQRLELRGLQRQLDFLALDYERLFLRTQGMAGRGGRVEAVTTNDLSPQPASALANGAAGLLGGFGIALFTLGFLTRARKEVWLADDLPIPLLGEVPSRKVSALPGPPWYDTAGAGRRKDAIQALRTAIEGSLDQSTGSLTVVGDRVDSTACRALAVDLAAAFASAGRLVLLVDADYSGVADMTEYDVGEPTLASVLELPGAASDTLKVRVSDLLDEAVYIRSDLAVMPAGPVPSSPADALAGRQLRVFLEQASDRFDLVVVVAGDARSPAAQVLTQRVGSALLAVAPGKTTKPGVTSLVTDLTQQRVRLLGAVTIHGKDSIVTLPSLSLRLRQERSPTEGTPSGSPITRLSLYPFPGSKRSALFDGGALQELADGLVSDVAGDGDAREAPTKEEKRDQLGSQVLDALRGSDREAVYEPVANYIVARVEDILTAVPGQANVSDELMSVVLRYGFVPLRSVKGHRSVGDWLIDELRLEVGSDQGEEIASELARVVDAAVAEPRDALNTWITDEFFLRHLDRTQREPDVWHLTSEGGTLQVLVNGRRLTRERLGYLTTDVIRGAIDDLQRQLKKATDAGDSEAAMAIEVRLKELHLFEIALGLLLVGSNDDGRNLYPWRRGDQQSQGWSPVWAEGVRPNLAPLQRLGLLASPVLTEDELFFSQSAG